MRALLEAFLKWGRCGARGRASQARTREALGRRPSPLRGTAFDGWTRRGRRAAKAARIREGAALPSAPGSYGPGDRKAAMERREAPALPTMERGKTEDWCAIASRVYPTCALNMLDLG